MLIKAILYLTALVAMLASVGHAAERRTTVPVKDADLRVMDTEGLSSAHPDYRWRRDALLALDEGRQTLAQKYLIRAARYADKPSQALIAERYWTGEGVAKNRALAYAWMDLAAERGYTHFTVHRERYWSAMTVAERQRALEIGKSIYEEYGDDVAKERKERLMSQALRRATGSHAGSRAGVRVYHPPARNPSGGAGIGKQQSAGQYYLGQEIPNYYNARFWKPKDYWEWQEAQFVGLPDGTVNVGEIEPGE